MENDDEARAVSEPGGGEPKQKMPPVETEAARVKREAEELRATLCAICPQDAGLGPVIDELVLAGKSLSECRATLAAEYAKTRKPVGTAEPEPIPELKTKDADVPIPVERIIDALTT